jgi:urease accessory protein
MLKNRPLASRTLAAGAFLSSITAAHAHHAEFMADKPFVQGLSMPVHGLDHLLSALTVGLLASQSVGSSRLKLPVLFATLTLLGGLLNVAGISLPELSVPIATGLAAVLLWSGSGATLASAVACITILAVTNGQALMQAPPAGIGAAVFGLGCVCSAAVLCALGFLMGSSLQLASKPLAGRVTAATLLGVLALAAVFPAVNEALIRLIEPTL